ncbi:H-type lectin domain-containing protein [Paracoccus caeni]|nr:H-type lectin domain-containing protein [Paracoccus caeni]
MMFSAFEDDGPMWSGEGPRLVRQAIRFPATFRRAPVVQVSISMWDVDGAGNQRADISSENIDAEGFDLVFRTWGDTRVARIRADWMAIGEVMHPDDFQV